MLVVAISGPTCAGKTTLGRALSARLGAKLVSVRSIICAVRPDARSSRRAMQAAGAELERISAGSWIADAVASNHQANTVVIDAIRTHAQRKAFRRISVEVVAVHLTASERVRRERYARRQRGERAYEGVGSFDELMGHPTEAGAEALEDGADILLDSSDASVLTLAETVACFVRNLEAS